MGRPISAGGSVESNQRHLAYLDGVRALAALWVLVAHAYETVWPGNLGRKPHGLTAHLTGWMVFGNGHYAVALFIVVSGFCLGLPVVRAGGVLRGGAIHFLRRRARRILPPYYFSFLLSLILVWTLIGDDIGSYWDISVPVDRAGYLGHLFLVQDVVGRNQADPPLWSVAVEWRIYFLFPLLILCWRRFGVTKTTMTAVWLAYAGFLATALVSWTARGANVQFVGLFALGTLAATIAFADREPWRSVRWRVPWAALAALFALPLILIHEIGGTGVSPARPLLDLLLGLFGVSLLVAGARPGRNRLRWVLGARPLAFLGAFSYSIYLVHAPLLQVAWRYGVRPFHLAEVPMLLVVDLLVVPLVLAASYLFFLVCERPFMSTQQRRAARGEFAETPQSARPVPIEPIPAPVHA
jgi:peptidoglycan/LPS O-acetylase OafA/YrhL